MDINSINDKMKNIPPDLIPEIIDYIDFLLNKYGIKKEKKKVFDFKWAGGLSEIPKKYSSVELQHKSMDWR